MLAEKPAFAICLRQLGWIAQCRAWAFAITIGLPHGALAAPPDTLARDIESADQAFFAAVFTRCDAHAVGAMVTDDFEFYHDKWGKIASSRQAFVKLIGAACERQRLGTDFKAKRRLNSLSLRVTSLGADNALEIGEHDFFRIGAGDSLTPTEYARFIHIWKKEANAWLLARVISYDHVDGPAPWAAP